jgi:hypothetical protein
MVKVFIQEKVGSTFLTAQVNFEPTFSCINTLTILKPSYYSSYLPASEDGTDRVSRNVGIQNSDAGELPRRKHTTSKLLRKTRTGFPAIPHDVQVVEGQKERLPHHIVSANRH